MFKLLIGSLKSDSGLKSCCELCVVPRWGIGIYNCITFDFTSATYLELPPPFSLFHLLGYAYTGAALHDAVGLRVLFTVAFTLNLTLPHI